ncbi:caspase family protein, partial [Caldovatus aquaticus]
MTGTPPAAILHRRARRLARALALAILALILLRPGAAARAQQERIALVIGNGAYRTVPRLANPGRDAQGMAEILRGIGFRVDLVRDATRAQQEEALRRFGRAADGAEIALFFYAGHGIQVGGENYLMPVDARVADARDIDYELVALPLVTRAMERARVRILILDACRDNPLAAQVRGLSGTRSVGRGLARIEQVDLGTLVAFATSPGAVALDGSGGNSPFTAALLRHLPTPGLEIRQVMTRVRASVVQQTGGQQIPWDNSSLVTEVVLRPVGGGT